MFPAQLVLLLGLPFALPGFIYLTSSSSLLVSGFLARHFLALDVLDVIVIDVAFLYQALKLVFKMRVVLIELSHHSSKFVIALICLFRVLPVFLQFLLLNGKPFHLSGFFVVPRRSRQIIEKDESGAAGDNQQKQRGELPVDHVQPVNPHDRQKYVTLHICRSN